MHARSRRPQSEHPSLIVWLAANTSGVPRTQARRVIVLGIVLGLVLGWVTSRVTGQAFIARTLGVVAV